MFKFALTRRVDNVSSLPKTSCTKLNIRRLFGFVWEALQMTKVWSCEHLQRRCRYSKVLEGLCDLSIKHSQPGTASWTCCFRSTGVARALAFDGQQNHFVCSSAGERQRT